MLPLRSRLLLRRRQSYTAHRKSTCPPLRRTQENPLLPRDPIASVSSKRPTSLAEVQKLIVCAHRNKDLDMRWPSSLASLMR